jgi:Coenzyme PQQ synthesis protein D (PqqD)
MASNPEKTKAAVTIEFKSDSVLQRDLDLIGVDMDGETVMMSVEHGAYYGIRGVGSRIWEMLEKPRQFNEIVTCVTDEYDVTREQATTEISEFLNTLSRNKLLKLL